MTLPSEVVTGLRKVHPDIAWAIVSLYERRPAARKDRPLADAELVDVASRHSLIAVNHAVVRRLPGVQFIPLNGNSAFLALEPGQGILDLELAVRDRLDDAGVQGVERRALTSLRSRLQQWRRDKRLRAHARAIIVVERVPRRARADTSNVGGLA